MPIFCEIKCTKSIVVSEKIRNDFIDSLNKAGVECKVYSDGIPYIMSVCFNKNVRGETLVHALEKKGVFISTGSACSSTKHMNRTLEAMGIDRNEILCSNRVSFSPYMDFDVEKTALIISEELKKLEDKKYE